MVEILAARVWDSRMGARAAPLAHPLDGLCPTSKPIWRSSAAFVPNLTPMDQACPCRGRIGLLSAIGGAGIPCQPRLPDRLAERLCECRVAAFPAMAVIGARLRTADTRGAPRIAARGISSILTGSPGESSARCAKTNATDFGPAQPCGSEIGSGCSGDGKGIDCGLPWSAREIIPVPGGPQFELRRTVSFGTPGALRDARRPRRDHGAATRPARTRAARDNSRCSTRTLQARCYLGHGVGCPTVPNALAARHLGPILQAPNNDHRPFPTRVEKRLTSFLR